MNRSISVFVNDSCLMFNQANRRPIVVKETDRIKIRVEVVVDGEGEDVIPEVYFEDYKCSVQPLSADFSVFETLESRYFSESFGFSAVRIQYESTIDIIAFDVQAKKTTVEQARRMINYLASHSESLIKTCFSRSSIAIGSTRFDHVDSETMLTTAEGFVEKLHSFQLELLNNLRERLIPVRIPLWECNGGIEIDPYDVINNLDALTPSSTSGQVFLRGRNFDIDGIYVSSVKSTADVIENQILLGGLYSIRRQIGNLVVELDALNSNPIEGQEGYESFARLMLSLTAGGMLRRCEDVLIAIEGFVKLFERKIGIGFQGEIAPVITPYVRSTRVYGMLFTQLSLWYELGMPSIDGLKFLMKLKSLSKIYEMYVLFQTIAQLSDSGWNIVDATPHETMGEYVPSEIVFSKFEEKINLQYEPVVAFWNAKTLHMDLIDVGHRRGAANPYWTPDFVIRLESKKQVRYVILDAKYSTRGSVKEFHIPSLFEKYYVGMAVYDDSAKMASHSQIVGVFAVFSLDERNPSYLSKWGRHGINHDLPRVPMIGGIGLMTENSDFFKSSLTTILDVARRTLN